MRLAPLTVAASILLPIVTFAGPLQEARINQIVNDVRVVDPQKGARPAALQDTVRDQIGVRTGIQSRAELLFQDATLTRLGAETFFSFKAGTRDLSLERGTMLLQVPKSRGGARIRTASVTASITGTTIMIESVPKKHVKVLVLEGSLRLTANGRFGESISLKPGKMIIMEANAKRLPEPVDVDIRKVVKTSALIDPELFKGRAKSTVQPLPSLALIQKEITLQEQRIGRQGLIPTNLVIAGNGTQVVAVSDETMLSLDSGMRSSPARNDRREPPAAGGAEVQATGERLAAASSLTEEESFVTSAARGSGGSFMTAAATAPVTDVTNRVFATTTETVSSLTEAGVPPGTSGFSPANAASRPGTSGPGKSGSGTSGSGGSSSASTPPPGHMASATDLVLTSFFTSISGNLSATGAIVPSGGAITSTLPWTISAGSISAGNGLLFPGADGTATSAPRAGGFLALFFAPELAFSSSGVNGVLLTGGNAFSGAGGNGGSIFMGSSLLPIPGDVTIAAPINASTGLNAGSTQFGGNGGTVSVTNRGTIDVNSTVKVSESSVGAASARAGSITLRSLKTSGTAIRIQNSGELLSLLASAAPGPGGTIRIASSGGEILVDGGRIQADRGTVDVRNSGLNGRITLRNADIRGDTVKIGALGANGQLIVGGGTINADTTLKLYGGATNGSVRFTDDVTLGGAGTKIIAGKTVTIDNGRTVTVGGSTSARVHTEQPNYTGSGGNGSTTGRFGGAGATTGTLGTRPAY